MRVIRNVTDISKGDSVYVISEISGIYYLQFGLGKKPVQQSGEEIASFIADSKTDEEILDYMIEAFNQESPEWRALRKELKQNDEGRKRRRKPLTSPEFRARMKRMASDPRARDYFS